MLGVLAGRLDGEVAVVGGQFASRLGEPAIGAVVEIPLGNHFT
jgi:hypothetical protein